MKIIYALLLALTFAGCSSSKKTPIPQNQAPDQIEPFWLKARPMNSAFYIGISRISKKSFPDNFSDQAKKMALEDLSQEIEVKVQANSILYTFEKNDSHREDFVQSIKLESNVDLEHFELVDIFETENEYALYYRLNKSEYLARKKALENKQIEIAKSWLDKSKGLSQNELLKELEFKLKAMESIKDYWSQALKTEVEGKEVFFGNYLFQSLQVSFNKIEMKMNTNSLKLPYGIPLTEKILEVSVSANGISLSSIPLKVQAIGLNLSYNQFTTNSSGKASISKIYGTKPMEVNLRVIPDLDRISSVSSQVKQAVLVGIKLPEVTCVTQVSTPKIYIEISKAGRSVLPELKETLSRIALLNENKKANSDLICKINLTTREGGEYNGLFTSFLDADFNFSTQNGSVFYTKKLTNIKGVDLSFDRGISKALESLKTKFANEIMPQVKQKLLKN